jgi:hypothetical protein
MDESDLRALRVAVEEHLDVPAFEEVAARGRRIRRRRTVGAGVAAAAAVLVTLVGISHPFTADHSQQPVDRPAPRPSLRLDQHGARQVLGAATAQVDSEASRIDGVGDLLARVVVADRSFTSRDRCGTGRVALRWSGVGGAQRSWTDTARTLVPLDQGFVVAAAPRACRSGTAPTREAYVVDGSGLPRALAWAPGAEAVCAGDPGDRRCRFDVEHARGRLAEVPALPPGTVSLGRDDGTSWARSVDGRRILWSRGGSAWRTRTTRLPRGDLVSASAAGRWAVLAGPSSVDYTDDGGTTWRHRDLTTALQPVRRGDVDWTVTRTGVLLGVTELVGRGDVLFRSTDAHWSHFVVSDLRTDLGLVTPTVVGGVVAVPDHERWAVSADDGATWRRTPPLP